METFDTVLSNETDLIIDCSPLCTYTGGILDTHKYCLTLVTANNNEIIPCRIPIYNLLYVVNGVCTFIKNIIS